MVEVRQNLGAGAQVTARMMTRTMAIRTPGGSAISRTGSCDTIFCRRIREMRAHSRDGKGWARVTNRTIRLPKVCPVERVGREGDLLCCKTTSKIDVSDVASRLVEGTDPARQWSV